MNGGCRRDRGGGCNRGATVAGRQPPAASAHMAPFTRAVGLQEARLLSRLLLAASSRR